MPQELWIEKVNVVDVDSATILRNRTVLIRDVRIASIEPAGDLSIQGSIDGRNCYLSPGLIDCHVHFFLNSGKHPRESFLDSNEEELMKCARENAALAIRAGITTMRDCAAPARLIFQLRREIETERTPGPHILTCGHALMRPGGHCHWVGGGEVTTPSQVRQTLERLLAEGADFIKLIASGGGLTPDTVPHEADFPIDLMQAAVEVARVHGVHITAHCHSTESICRSIDAGLDMIEHANFLEPPGRFRFDETTAKRIRDHGIVVSPTVYVGLQTARRFRRAGGSHNPNDVAALERFEGRRTNTASFCRLGIPVIGGTDCGATDTPFDSLAEEILLYAQAGFSSGEVLKSVTCNSARWLKIPETGKIERGYHADLLLLQENPLENLKTLREPLKVFKSGKLVWDRSSALMPRSRFNRASQL